MFSIIRKARKLFLPIDMQLNLFDTMVTPIILYGSEIWGIENIDIIDRFQLKYCKLILNLKSSTPNCMVYGECRVFCIIMYSCIIFPALACERAVVC